MSFGRALPWRVLVALAIAAPCMADASPATAADHRGGGTGRSVAGSGARGSPPAGLRWITLNADLNTTRTLPGGATIPGLTISWTGGWGPVFLHEIGHVLGLDHVDDRLQLMYGEAGFGTNYFSGGDLAGLHQVGAAGGCL